MSTTEDRSSDAKLEVIVIPVSDVDRAKEFYGRLGWRLDADTGGTEFRLIQFTPPGSGTSITFGEGLTTAAPGSAGGGLIVSRSVPPIFSLVQAAVYTSTPDDWLRGEALKDLVQRAELAAFLRARR